jgi:hypothetical protein
MDERDDEKKSEHLKELEEAFEKRTRRFSPFAILGLTPQASKRRSETAEEPSSALEPSETLPGAVEPSPGLERHPPVPYRRIDNAESPTFHRI